MRNPASKTTGFTYCFLSLFRRKLNIGEDKQDTPTVERYWEKRLCVKSTSKVPTSQCKGCFNIMLMVCLKGCNHDCSLSFPQGNSKYIQSEL